MTSRFGASAALTTPFTAEGRVDLALLVSHAQACLARGCGSITLFGTTGEGSSVSEEEREAAFDAAFAAGITGQQLVAGVLVSAAGDAARQAKRALERGVRNVLLAPPSYFKNVSDDGVFRWFADTFAAIGPAARDILVYNLPSVTAVKLSLPLVTRLREAFPGIVAGVKDSGGDWSHSEQLLRRHADLVILIGDERHLAQSVRMGGQGAISGMANFAPEIIAKMSADGEEDHRVPRFVETILRYQVTPAVKTLVAHLSGNEDWARVRAPLDAITPGDRASLVAAHGEIFGAAA